jgi:hypothetical protein
MKSIGLPPQVRGEWLRILGDALARARNSAQADAQPELGDKGWGTGCRAYERQCFAISSLEQEHRWLHVVDDGMEFLFTVAGLPIRFFHGSAARAPAKHRIQSIVEREQYRLFGDATEDTVFRFVLETDSKGFASRVVLIRTAPDGDRIGEPEVVWTPSAAAEVQSKRAAQSPVPDVEPILGDEDQEAGADGS